MGTGWVVFLLVCLSLSEVETDSTRSMATLLLLLLLLLRLLFQRLTQRANAKMVVAPAKCQGARLYRESTGMGLVLFTMYIFLDQLSLS